MYYWYLFWCRKTFRTGHWKFMIGYVYKSKKILPLLVPVILSRSTLIWCTLPNSSNIVRRSFSSIDLEFEIFVHYKFWYLVFKWNVWNLPNKIKYDEKNMKHATWSFCSVTSLYKLFHHIIRFVPMTLSSVHTIAIIIIYTISFCRT